MKMHWIYEMRKSLGISQEKMAAFLRLSKHTLRSIEHDRRFIPLTHATSAMTLYEAVGQALATGPANDLPVNEGDHVCRLQRLCHQYRQRLENMTDALVVMCRKYHTAGISLLAYRLYSDAVSGQADEARDKWVAYRADEARQQQQANSPTAQALLAAEIAAFRKMVTTLEQMLTPAESGEVKISDHKTLPA